MIGTASNFEITSPALSNGNFWFFSATPSALIHSNGIGSIWLVLPMRFIYRPVLNIVVVRAILRALKGVWVGWGKLDRTASVLYRA